MRPDELVERIVALVRELGGEADWLQVFTPDVVDALARLLPAEYESFKTRFEGSLLLDGLKLKGMSERKLDRLVDAARARLEEEALVVPLGECCPGAPGAEGLMVPRGWEVSADGVRLVGGSRVASGAVYADGRYQDAERGRSYIRLVAFADGEWRHALVPADASDSRLVAVVRNLGVLVECSRSLAGYLRSFLSLNWGHLPVVAAPVEGEVLFEAWRDFVEANASRFLGGAGGWGAVRGEELLVLPDVLRRFLRARGASFHSVLSAWRREGYLVAAEDGLLAPRWLMGRTRRVAVFRASLFSLGAVANGPDCSALGGRAGQGML